MVFLLYLGVSYRFPSGSQGKITKSVLRHFEYVHVWIDGCISLLSELPACEACSFEQLVIFDREGLGHGALTADNDQFRGLPSLNGIRIVPWDRIPTRLD